MPKLKLIGEIECQECGGLIKIDENMGVHNFIGQRCPGCNTLNTIRVDINDGKVRKNIKK